jgi:CBS domain containing-hemolysin-like protein
MAGLVFGTLGRAPEVQDRVVVDGVALTVLEVEGSRIVRLEVELGVEGGAMPPPREPEAA